MVTMLPIELSKLTSLVRTDSYVAISPWNFDPCLPMASVKSDSGKLQTDSSPRERRYTMRYPFSADAEILSLKSGTRVGGVTSDLSLGGCFVCTRLSLEIGTGSA
jgi:hypothetical protein